MIWYFGIAYLIVGFVLFVYAGIKQKKPEYVEPKFGYQPITKNKLNEKETELLNLINSHRDFLGLPALIPEVLASKVCQEAIADDLELNERPSHHQWEQRKLACMAADAKEIISPNMVEPRSAFAGYLRSHDHRAVIENRESTHIGLAYYENINYCILTRY